MEASKKSVTVAVRLRPAIAKRLDEVLDGRSRSETVRDAIRLLLATETLADRPSRPQRVAASSR